MYIKLKQEINLKEMNEILKQNGIENKFITEETITAIAEDINTNPKLRHLKPERRNITNDEVKELFPTWTEIGLFETDLYFGRTSEEEMQKIAEFIIENADKIEYITEVETLIERGKIHNRCHMLLKKLEKKYEKPKMLPKEKRVINNHQSGLLLCKTWGTNKDLVWLIFGKVDRPKYLKNKIYENDIYNDIYKDKRGNSYMLIPLNDMSKDFGIKTFNQMWDMGIRENPNYILSLIYQYEIINENVVGEDFAKFYNVTELKERLNTVIKKIYYLFPKIEVRIDNKKIKYIGQYMDTNIFGCYTKLANSLIYSLEKYYGKLMCINNGAICFEKGMVRVNILTNQKNIIA